MPTPGDPVRDLADARPGSEGIGLDVGETRLALLGHQEIERILDELEKLCGCDYESFIVIFGFLRGFGADRVAIWSDSGRIEPDLKLFEAFYFFFFFLLLGHQEIERILDELEKLCGWNVYFYYVILGVLRRFGADRVAN
eukprot:TRINITY_DN5505_c0_g1_i2.p2 TRINITY_DN5505_c0_g1~~TRINITY_DN5505_c0_g1_i2.p2  ORF type:complete len:140 (-),score=9.62 TRINITY_DN5505_c0_g1_i2:256-675(-)